MKVEELIERLRNQAAWLDGTLAVVNLMGNAAEALAAQADRMKELEDTKADLEDRTSGMNRYMQERDALQSKLDTLQKPVPDEIVAGALYDFLGYLTSRRTRVTMSDRDTAGPAVDALIDWSKTRRINLVEARVKDWDSFTAPTQGVNAAVGLQHGDKLEIVMPQFHRTDDVQVSAPNLTPDEWNNLGKLSLARVRQMGFQVWDDDAKGIHWLFPAEWYDYIPNGTKVVDINGNEEVFVRGETDNDMRFGALSFGFITFR